MAKPGLAGGAVPQGTCSRRSHCRLLLLWYVLPLWRVGCPARSTGTPRPCVAKAVGAGPPAFPPRSPPRLPSSWRLHSIPIHGTGAHLIVPCRLPRGRVAGSLRAVGVVCGQRLRKWTAVPAACHVFPTTHTLTAFAFGHAPRRADTCPFRRLPCPRLHASSATTAFLS